VASAAQAEAHACVEAIQAAVAWGMTQVQTESDSQNLIRALLSKDYDLAAEGIYRDVRLSLCLNFDKVLFSFVSRDCNKIAHCLAPYCTDRQEARSLWSESLPDDVVVLMASYGAAPCV
jgi:ribonuclease HI